MRQRTIRTPKRSRRTIAGTTALGLVGSILLIACAHHPPATSTIIDGPQRATDHRAPVTLTHPPRTSRQITEQPQLTAPASHPAATSPGSTDPTESEAGTTPPTTATGNPAIGEPSGVRTLTDPTYHLNAIDRTAPEQVAWAYLTLRMSYSYQDADPDQHNQLAATYAANRRTSSATPTQTSTVEFSGWSQVVTDHLNATVTVTTIEVEPSTAKNHTSQALVRISWTRTLSSQLNAPVRASNATTLTLQRNKTGTWLVTHDGFAGPN